MIQTFLTSSDLRSLYLTSPVLYSGGLRFKSLPAISNIDLNFSLCTEILVGDCSTASRSVVQNLNNCLTAEYSR
jgi:hypothetical protein